MEKIVKADAARPSSPSLEGELMHFRLGPYINIKRSSFLECTQKSVGKFISNFDNNEPRYCVELPLDLFPVIIY
jgi:hypothetical protein